MADRLAARQFALVARFVLSDAVGSKVSAYSVAWNMPYAGQLRAVLTRVVGHELRHVHGLEWLCAWHLCGRLPVQLPTRFNSLLWSTVLLFRFLIVVVVVFFFWLSGQAGQDQRATHACRSPGAATATATIQGSACATRGGRARSAALRYAPSRVAMVPARRRTRARAHLAGARPPQAARAALRSSRPRA